MSILVTGAGGFIGGHLATRLSDDGHQVVATDIKPVDEWYQSDPRVEKVQNLDLKVASRDYLISVMKDYNVTEVYALAADMGGMGFIETHKLDCALSVLITTNTMWAAALAGVNRLFYASSACVYPAYRQDKLDQPALRESDAYPAEPEDGYGWEKLFGERLARHMAEETGLTTRVARYHNIYGPQGTYQGGREKAPAATCRKVANAVLTGDMRIDIWGDGSQQRSYTYIDDCVKGTIDLMHSDVDVPLNIGSSEMVSVDQLVTIVEDIAGVKLERSYDPTKPQGVKGRNSDNTLIQELMGWEPSTSLHDGLTSTYEWILGEMKK